jgi:hypothetical protein
MKSTNYERRMTGVVESAPIIVMSALFPTPVVQFWLWAWGPLRPFDVAAVPAPSVVVVFASLAACLVAAHPPARYFAVCGFERNGRIYRAVGVRLFRDVVPNGDWINRLRRRHNRRFRLIASSADAPAWVAKTKTSEKGHLVLMIVGILSAGYAAHIGWTWWAAGLVIGNVVTNLYPVLLQRYTRARLVRVVAASARRAVVTTR